MKAVYVKYGNIFKNISENSKEWMNDSYIFETSFSATICIPDSSKLPFIHSIPELNLFLNLESLKLFYTNY